MKWRTMSKQETSRLDDSQKTPFQPNTTFMDLAPEQHAVFAKAAQLLDYDLMLTECIFASGGNRQHVNNFSIYKCGCIPIDSWAKQAGYDTTMKALQDMARKGEL